MEERAAQGLPCKAPPPSGARQVRRRACASRVSGRDPPGPRTVAEGMISTRRIVAAVGLAVGVTGLAAPMANADATADATRFNPMTALDSVAAA